MRAHSRLLTGAAPSARLSVDLHQILVHPHSQSLRGKALQMGVYGGTAYKFCRLHRG